MLKNLQNILKVNAKFLFAFFDINVNVSSDNKSFHWYQKPTDAGLTRKISRCEPLEYK